MSILSGYKKFKKYLKTTDGYQLISYFTSSDTVNMVDENGNITDTTLTESISKVGKGRELTQAEYDALSEEEKRNGTVYYITDSGGVVSVVALTREAYDALGDTTSADGRIYLVTDEKYEKTDKNIAFDDSNTTIGASTVHDAIEALNIDIVKINDKYKEEYIDISVTDVTASLTRYSIGNINQPDGYSVDTVYMTSYGNGKTMYSSNFVAVPFIGSSVLYVAIQKVAGSSTTFTGKACIRYKKNEN